MFSNLRFVSVVTFGILVILTLFAGIYFKYASVENVVKTSAAEQSEILSDVYTATVWNRYYPVINYILTKPEKEWKTYPQYLAFLEDSEDLFFPDNLVKVVIRGNNGAVVLDSNEKLELSEKQSFLKSFLDKDHVEEARQNAKGGKSSSVIMPNAFVDAAGKKEKRSIIKSFIPIKVTEIRKGFEDQAPKGTAIMEINYDISSTMKRLEFIQFTSVFLIICALAILTVAVFIASQKAEKVIEEQQEASMEMASAKSSAEAENKAKSQFLANISHELRTPLNAIIGFSEIINAETMGPLNNQQYKDFVKDIHTSGVHLLSLINDILDFSKAEENKLDVDFEELDVTKLVKVSMRMVMPRAEESNVKLVENVPPEHLILKADPKRLKQVILNLLSNAVKFTQEGGEVSVKVWKDDDGTFMYFEVRDNGVGMEAQDLAKALSPFGQVDSKLSRRYEGTGLGLPLSKKLVEMMNGKFDMISEVGLGTTVTLSFPLHAFEAATDDGDDAQSAPPASPAPVPDEAQATPPMQEMTEEKLVPESQEEPVESPDPQVQEEEPKVTKVVLESDAANPPKPMVGDEAEEKPEAPMPEDVKVTKVNLDSDDSNPPKPMVGEESSTEIPALGEVGGMNEAQQPAAEPKSKAKPAVKSNVEIGEVGESSTDK